MKMCNFLVGMAIGLAVGAVVVQLEPVKKVMTKGKKKLKNFLNSNED